LDYTRQGRRAKITGQHSHGRLLGNHRRQKGRYAVLQVAASKPMPYRVGPASVPADRDPGARILNRFKARGRAWAGPGAGFDPPGKTARSPRVTLGLEHSWLPVTVETAPPPALEERHRIIAPSRQVTNARIATAEDRGGGGGGVRVPGPRKTRRWAEFFPAVSGQFSGPGRCQAGWQNSADRGGGAR